MMSMKRRVSLSILEGAVKEFFYHPRHDREIQARYKSLAILDSLFRGNDMGQKLKEKRSHVFRMGIRCTGYLVVLY